MKYSEELENQVIEMNKNYTVPVEMTKEQVVLFKIADILEDDTLNEAEERVTRITEAIDQWLLD